MAGHLQNLEKHLGYLMVITVCATEDLDGFKQGTVIVWFSYHVPYKPQA